MYRIFQKFKLFLLFIILIMNGKEVRTVIISLNNVTTTHAGWYPHVIIIINTAIIEISNIM